MNEFFEIGDASKGRIRLNRRDFDHFGSSTNKTGRGIRLSLVTRGGMNFSVLWGSDFTTSGNTLLANASIAAARPLTTSQPKQTGWNYLVPKGRLCSDRIDFFQSQYESLLFENRSVVVIP